MKRDSYFYMSYYVVPSVIFIIVAYSSFWVDANAAPARCGLSITIILITINFQTQLSTVLPPIDSGIWLESYFTGVLVFTCVAMIEYTFVNFTSVNYAAMKGQIEEMVQNIKKSVNNMK